MSWQEYTVFLLESLGLQCPELMMHYYRKIKILMDYYIQEEKKSEIEWVDTAMPRDINDDRAKWYNWRRIALAVEKNDYELRSCQYGLTRVDEGELIDISNKYGKMLGIENKKTKTYQKYQDIL
jgi:predicted phosphoadenosine phosphosulfate sulfurtransferase